VNFESESFFLSPALSEGKGEFVCKNGRFYSLNQFNSDLLYPYNLVQFIICYLILGSSLGIFSYKKLALPILYGEITVESIK
jgi:hypothetical protein